MLFFGDKYTATELHKMGVAWRVVSDDHLQSQAIEVAQHLAQLPMLSVRAMKRVLNKTAAPDLLYAMQLETDATVAGFMDPETTRLLSDF
jgi:enoyl-CoA hydratase/carnithine racemase